MAFVLLDSVSATGVPNTATTGDLDSTGADLIVVIISQFVANGTLSDSEGNSWTQLTDQAGTNSRSRMFYAISPITSSTHTFTFTCPGCNAGDAPYAVVGAAAFSAGDTVQFDQETGAVTPIGTSVTPGSITPGAAENLLITSQTVDNTHGDQSVTGGFTELYDVAYNASSNMGGQAAYLIQSAATAADPTWSSVLARGRTSQLASFVEGPPAKQITPNGIVSGEVFGSPTVQVGIVLAPPAIATAEAFGQTTVIGPQSVEPESITSSEAFGQALLTEPQAVAPGEILSGESFGSPVIGLVLTIDPESIGSGETFGSPAIQVGLVLAPTSITSGEAFGTSVIGVDQIVAPGSIDSVETIGSPNIASGQFVSPASISSGEVFGQTFVIGPQTITAASISTSEAFGTVNVSTTIVICHRPADRQQSRLIRQSLYALKRQYGAAIQVYQLEDSVTDLLTGNKSVSKSVYPIRRAVILPAQLQREVIQSISQISANKKFVTGGTFDRGHRNFIIDAHDLPCGFKFTNDDWIVFRNRRYEMKQISEFEFQAGWVVTGREILGRVPEQIFPVKADDLLTLSDQGSA